MLKDSRNYNAVEFTGTTEVAGVSHDISRRVYQLKDLDPNKVTNGKTNLELMKAGNNPYDNDGNMIILHHTIQKEVGPIAELSAKTHQKHTKILHGTINDGDSFRRDPLLSSLYENFNPQYWRARATQFE